MPDTPSLAPEHGDAFHLLVVDDDSDIRSLLADYLRRHGFTVESAADGAEMRQKLAASSFDLLVLDIMMPGEDGLSLCRSLRAKSREANEPDTPVIFLTALGEATDRVVGLEIGADDYVVKPFEPRELLARNRAVLRRSGNNASSRADKAENQCRAYRFNGWTLDLIARHLRDPEGMVVNLSGAEFRLLQLLLEHPRQVLSREILQEQGQGREAERSPFDRSLDVQICRLRARLRDKGREGGLIKTVRGDGYVFAADVSPEGIAVPPDAEPAGA